MRSFVFATVLAASFVTVGCDAPSIQDTVWRCSSDADCGAGWVCDPALGGCVQSINPGEGEGEGEGEPRCDGDDGCGVGFYCEDAVCLDLASTSDAPGVSATSIVVGLTAPLQTGPREEGSSFAAGVRAAFSLKNAAGGVRNRQLVLNAKDDGAVPSRAAANVAAFVEDGGADEAFAVLAGTTQVGDTAKDATVGAGRLFIAGRASNSSIYEAFDQLVFSTRPSLADEVENTLRYFISSGDLRVPLQNFALLAEAETAANDASLTALSSELQAALQEEIDQRVLPPSMPPQPPLLRYAQNSQDMDAAVTAALQWIGSGTIEANEVGDRPVVIALGATSKPAGAFVEAMLNAFHEVKLGVVAASAFGLSDQQLTRLQNVQDLTFWAPAEVGLDSLSAETQALGMYTTVSGDVAYCSRVISTQVVPEVTAGSTATAYLAALADLDGSALPSRAGFEGFIAAQTLIAGLDDVAPAIGTTAWVSAMEQKPPLDFGAGAIDFTASSHIGVQNFYGVGFADSCTSTNLDLDLPDQPPPVSECPGGVCLIQGVIFGDNGTNTFTMTAGFEYLLRGTVFVGDDSSETRLVIEPGTVIKGEFATTGTLVIRRGSKIIADGTKQDPILFTSENAPGSRATGDWGGIVINGRSPLNCNVGVQLTEGTTDASGTCQGIGEGATGLFGGTDENDDSGVLRYVRVEYAGKRIQDGTTGIENELNGIAFQGVGRSTVVDYIHVHRGQDDAVEFFGGTVDVKHMLITCPDDDGFDWVGGYRGRAQHVLIQQCDGHGDNGIEADNRAANTATGLGNNLDPRSSPMLANFTIIGLNSADTTHSNFGALVRQGTHVTVANSLIMGFNKDCIDIDQSATFVEAAAVDGDGFLVTTGNVVMTGTTVACASSFEIEVGDPFPVGDFFVAAGVGNEALSLATQIVTGPFQTIDSDGNDERFNPVAGSTVLTGVQSFTDIYEAVEGGFFDTVSYRGAVGPDDDWTRGWTTFTEN